MEQMTMIAAIRKHIGMLPGETLAEFSGQYKKLTDKDKADLKTEFAEIGVEIIEKPAA